MSAAGRLRILAIIAAAAGILLIGASLGAEDPSSLPYPFADRNVFFGLSLINEREDGPIVEDLGISWLSLQPHILWMAIERIGDHVSARLP